MSFTLSVHYESCGYQTSMNSLKVRSCKLLWRNKLEHLCWDLMGWGVVGLFFLPAVEDYMATSEDVCWISYNNCIETIRSSIFLSKMSVWRPHIKPFGGGERIVSFQTCTDFYEKLIGQTFS